MFGRAEFEEMAAHLRGLSGRFILSINDVPEIRSIIAGFEMDAVELTYTVGDGNIGYSAKELIILGAANGRAIHPC